MLSFTITLYLLEEEIMKQDSCLLRHPSENLQAYLLGHKLVHQICDLYENGQHDPNESGDEEYQIYARLLLKLVDARVQYTKSIH
jgi:hypothetical protein